MRNFKKFLALVLAMLMVSACAVSVSAAYADQDEINPKYAEAVEVLSMLGVIAGDGTNFNPADGLTRAAAAKIATLLDTGIEGTQVEWSATAVSAFTDVPLTHWGLGYINYVYSAGIMDGIGDGKFDPDAQLTIEQAVTIAVKAAGLRSEVVELEKINPTTAGNWSANYLAVAKDYELVEKSALFMPTNPCSRELFAQIAYNVLNNVEDIKEGFGLENKEAYVEAVADGKVTLTGINMPVDEAAFNAALPEGLKAADLIDYKVNILWSTAVATYPIYSVSVESDVYKLSYENSVLDYAKDADNNNAIIANKIKISGTTYKLGTVDQPLNGEETSSTIGGSIAAASKDGIKFYLNGEEISGKEGEVVVADGTIPAYYTVVAYDDDGDTDYERAYVTSYDIAWVKDGGLVDHDANEDTAKVQKTVIDFVDDIETIEITEAVITAGVAYSNDIPALVHVDGKNVTVLKSATPVVGQVSNVSATYIKVGGTSYTFAPAYVAVDSATGIIGQTITIYTIDNKYVNYVSGISAKNVLVDNVTVENGAAIVTGYAVSLSADAFSVAPVQLTVIGIEDGSGRLQSRVADRVGGAYVDDNNKPGPDYNHDDKIDAADNAFTLVGLGKYDSNNKFVSEVTLNDKTFYSFKVNSDGKAYYAGAGTNYLAQILDGVTAQPSSTLKLEGAYIKEGATPAAVYKLAGVPVVIYETALADYSGAAYNAYSAEFKVDTKLPVCASLNYVAFNAKGVAVAKTEAIAEGNEIAFIYLTNIDKGTPETTKKIENLADGTSIARIEALDSLTISDNVYKAIDIFSGEVVYISYAPAVGETAEGAYVEYNTADLKVTAFNTKWVGANTFNEITEGAFVTGHYVYDTYLVADVETGAILSREIYDADANKIVCGVDNLKAMKLDDNGKLVVNTEYTVATGSFFGYVNGNTIIVLPAPAAE